MHCEHLTQGSIEQLHFNCSPMDHGASNGLGPSHLVFLQIDWPDTRKQRLWVRAEIALVDLLYGKPPEDPQILLEYASHLQKRLEIVHKAVRSGFN